MTTRINLLPWREMRRREQDRQLLTIAVGAAEWLRPGGWLVLEIGTGQGAAVVALLTAAGFTDVEIRNDLAGHDRIAIARK